VRIRRLKLTGASRPGDAPLRTQYPSGSKMNARKFIFPSQRHFVRHPKPLEARTRRLDVWHGDGDVTEPLRLLIARAGCRRFEVLCAVVACKLEDAW
jgi:hypothetical protein